MITNFQSRYLGQLQQSILKGDAPEVVQKLIEIAVSERASDIHVEPQELFVRVRIRVDGKLHKLVEYTKQLHNSIVSRVKILSNLRIDEHRKPQDGRIGTKNAEGNDVDIRLSLFPTVMGEKIVMRLVDKSNKIPELAELGLEGNHLKIVQQILSKPNGIILNTGPTGSGKTTTLYAFLNQLNHEDVNILTMEDPVEYKMNGLNQSQVNHEIGYTFANGLRNALRQDPDIMMVGEIRDKETLETSIEAALTGHLVLSTLHTNSAIETITRLLNMQVARYLITSTVQLIIAQRLARLLCEECKKFETPSAEVQREVLTVLSAVNKQELLARLPNFNPHEFKVGVAGKGCDACNGTGYKGRLPIFEMVQFTEPFQKAILEERSSHELGILAAQQGTIFLRQDGIIRVLQGKTSLEDVLAKT